MNPFSFLTAGLRNLGAAANELAESLRSLKADVDNRHALPADTQSEALGNGHAKNRLPHVAAKNGR